jgi:hypothetical protein
MWKFLIFYCFVVPGFPPFEKFKYGHFRKILIRTKLNKIRTKFIHIFILVLVKIKSKVTTQHYFFRELNPTFFNRFWAANYDSVLSFFTGFWDNLQWIFQKHWKCPNWVTLSDSKNIYNKIFHKIQRIRGFFDNKCSLQNQNWFWNLSSTSALSQIWNAWKLPSACLKENSVP